MVQLPAQVTEGAKVESEAQGVQAMTPPSQGRGLTMRFCESSVVTAGLLGLDLPRTAETAPKGCRHFSGAVWSGNHLSSISFGLHVRAKDVCVQSETGYKGPPPASAERSCRTAIRSRAQALKDVHSGVAPRVKPQLRTRKVLGTNPCGVHQGLSSLKKREPDLGWAWRPDRLEEVKLTPAEHRVKVFREARAAKRRAKKARKAARQGAFRPRQTFSAPPSDAARFYDSWEWKKVRFEVLKAYGAICMCCRATERIVVDHIKPRRKFPALQLDFDNLQVLCDSCNRGKSNDDYTDFRPIKPEPELRGEELAHMKSITLA